MIPGSFNFDQIKPVNPLLGLFPTGAYGIEYAFRVYKMVDRLAEFEKLGAAPRQILKFCALFAGIGREENQMVSNYGLKSYEKLTEHKFLGKSCFNNERCRFLIQCQSLNMDEIQNKIDEYQTENRDEALFLFKILKDALVLDAFRFGNFCANDLELSNSKKLVLFASQFHRKEIKQEDILIEIEDWLKGIQ
ncbi:hypothetical protein ACXR6G_05135 [Ancylomarina sp. YFZ004]